jgi:hypothetical protein
MTAPFSSSRLRELHDRLGSMIDQVGQPDYSLREMVKGLREVRDAMFILSESGALPPGVASMIANQQEPDADLRRAAAIAADRSGDKSGEFNCDQCGAEPGRCMTATICAQERQSRRERIAPSHVAALTPDWCMDAFWRANPGRNAVVPSLYLLDFAREVLRVHGVQSATAVNCAACGAETYRVCPRCAESNTKE